MKFLVVLSGLILMCRVNAQSSPTSELRGLWLASVNNMDWPSSSNLTTSDQQKELLDYLELAARMRMNVIFFHVRPMSDALYKSTIEPWSSFLTGTQGKAPDPEWDPLEYAVSHGHRLGLQIHAWINPYRANVKPSFEGISNDSIAHALFQYAYPYSSYLWMDPGSREVEDWVSGVVADIVTRYQVDGVHIDDYFYPYPDGTHFPDNGSYDYYRDSGGELNLEDFRRNNTARLVQRLYTITTIEHNKKFSVSPFPYYKTGEPGGQPGTLIKADAYSTLFTDTKQWFQEGWMDYFIPQLYNPIDPPNKSFHTLLDWWLSVNTKNISVCPGLAVYKLTSQDWPVEEIERQIELTRQWADRRSVGNVIFNGNSIRDNAKGIQQWLPEKLYTNNATVPSF